MKKTINISPLYEMDLDVCKLRVERNDLGITILDQENKTIYWLNVIETAVLKRWLEEFDPEDKLKEHPSVKEYLQKDLTLREYMEKLTTKTPHFDYEGL